MQNRLIAPSTDFRSVRDGRNSQVYYYDVALDTARSAAAGTGLVLPISGNAFYCDANPGDGNAYVHFQDTNFDRSPAPLYVSPGVIFNIPFTQVLIENSAQPGKKIRIAYGIDIDFQPGSVAQIAVTNAGGYTAVRPEQQTGFYNTSVAMVANTPETVFTPASNVNGAIILSAGCLQVIASAPSTAYLITKSSAPVSINDGSILFHPSGLSINGAGTYGISSGNLPSPQYVAPGQGLYWISQDALLGASASNPVNRSVRYKLL